MNNSRKTYFRSIIKKNNENLDRNSLQYILNRFDEFEHGWLQVNSKNIYNFPTSYICKKMTWRVFGGEATWSPSKPEYENMWNNVCRVINWNPNEKNIYYNRPINF